MVGGLFNLAMVVRDRLFHNETEKEMTVVVDSKMVTTKNMDLLSRRFAEDIDYFVCFSSVSAGHGFMSQTNYGWANSAMERICEKRQLDGLPALAIQWGPIDDVGIWERIEDKSIMAHLGYKHQKIDSCLNVLDRFMQSNHAVLCSYEKIEKIEIIQEKKQERTLTDKIMKMLNISIRTKLSNETTLAQLGVDSIVVVDVMKLLEENGYNIELQNIAKLTLNDIDELGIVDNI